MINPAIEGFPNALRLVGGMVIGYGELDITLCLVAGAAIGMRQELLLSLEPVNSELARIKVLERMAAPGFAKLGFTELFTSVCKDMHYCREVRNLYAHCLWAAHDGRLYLSKVQWFGDSEPSSYLAIPWSHVTDELLQSQEAYFEHTRKRLLYLEHAVARKTAGREPQLLEPGEIARPKVHSAKSPLQPQDTR